MNRMISLVGPFTDEDIAYLLQAVRHCEQKQPDKDFGVTVQTEEENRSLEDVRRFMRENFPAVEDNPVHIETYRRRK